jgi:hypothetical protein
MRVVVTEYPKSGGTWVTSLLGDALNLAKRDLYVSDGYNVFDVTKHPWYVGASNLELTESCVIKSHELPTSGLLDFPAQFVHLVRDGRDVIVSRYFFEKDFSVANGIRSTFDTPFDDYVVEVADAWNSYVLAWLGSTPTFCRYEDFVRDTAGTIRKVLSDIGIDAAAARIQAAVDANTKERISRSLDVAFKHNTFVRKGVPGDWVNYFSGKNLDTFRRLAGTALQRLGYQW